MNEMTVAEAKKDFERGLLKGFRIDKVGMSDNWMVMLDTVSGSAFLVDARTRQVRAFKTLDAVVNTLESVGFKVLSLVG